MTYSALNQRRVSDITVGDISSFLRAARKRPYAGAQLVAKASAVEFVRQSEVQPTHPLGVLPAAGSAWIRVTADPIGVWCALQAWSASLTAAPLTVRDKAALSRTFPGVGLSVWDYGVAHVRLAQDWAAARGQEGIEIGLDGSVVSGVWPMPEIGMHGIETGESVCAGVYANPVEVVAALTMLALANELRVKKSSP